MTRKRSLGCSRAAASGSTCASRACRASFDEARASSFSLALMILIFGMVSYTSLPREAAPDITIPYIFIMTNYAGVAPEDIESSITIPIEKKLKGLEGVKSIESSSTEGISSIVVEFVAGTDIDDVLTKTKDKVDMAKQDLPRDLLTFHAGCIRGAYPQILE